MKVKESYRLIEDPEKVKRVARLLKTVAHPSRLLIIDLLLENGPMPVKAIFEAVKISQSNASQHLKALEQVEVLGSKRNGKSILYFVSHPNIHNLVDCVNKCVDC